MPLAKIGSFIITGRLCQVADGIMLENKVRHRPFWVDVSFRPPTQPTWGHPTNDALKSWHAIKNGEMLNQIVPLEVSWAGMRNWAALPTVEIYQTRADTKYSQAVLK